MPTPVAHALSGLAVYAAVAAPIDPVGSPGSLAGGVGASARAAVRVLWADRGRVFAFVAVACACDLDYLLGLPWLQPHRFHQLWAHSLAFAVLVAVVVWIAGRGRAWARGIPFVAWAAAAIAHPLMDLVTEDTSLPRGIPLLWPLTWRRFHAPFDLFPHPAKSTFTALFSLHNVGVVAVELALCLPVVAGILWFRRRPSAAAG